MIRTGKKKRARNAMIRDLDDYARQQVFERDGKHCVRCTNPGRDWAHIMNRRHLATRWELDNALTLCGGCHFWWHSMPLLSMDWFRKNWPERHDNIIRIFNSGIKTSNAWIAEQWRAREINQPHAAADSRFSELHSGITDPPQRQSRMDSAREN